MRYNPIVSRESAQYPFMTRASDEVAKMGLDFEDLADPMYVRVLNRAQGRVNEAIVYGRVESKIVDASSELLSYALAGAFVVSIGDQYLTRRYAMAEAKRVHYILREEPNRRVIADLVRDELGWDVKLVIPAVEKDVGGIKIVYCFDLYFANYLSASTSFKETEWKMGNKVVRDGYVLLTQKQLARLVENMVEKEAIERLSRPVKLKLPEPMLARVEEIRALLDKNRPKVTSDQIPSQVVKGAFPPCISYYLEGVMAGRKAGHMERFALVSFLANVHMGVEDIVKLFAQVSDFSESLTRYQVEHISGTRRGGKPYTPPTCKTLQSHGICRALSDGKRICGNIAHPLQYYRICTRAR
jgi:DNA primase large subunit